MFSFAYSAVAMKVGYVTEPFQQRESKVIGN